SEASMRLLTIEDVQLAWTPGFSDGLMTEYALRINGTKTDAGYITLRNFTYRGVSRAIGILCQQPVRRLRLENHDILDPTQRFLVVNSGHGHLPVALEYIGGRMITTDLTSPIAAPSFTSPGGLMEGVLMRGVGAFANAVLSADGGH